MRGLRKEFNAIYSADGANSYRYLYILNTNDSTVSVFDTSTLTVIATIALTGSTSFNNINWVGASKSVYVTAANHYNRIDANPASGTFNTVVQSGAMTNNASNFHLKYDPHWDAFVGTDGFYRINQNLSLNLASANLFDPIGSRFINNNRARVSQAFAGASGPMVYLPRLGAFLILQNNNGLGYQILVLRELNGENLLLPSGNLIGFNNIGVTNVIGEYIVAGRISAASFNISDVQSGQNLLSFAGIGTDRAAAKFAPIAQGGRVFTYQRINTNRFLGVFNWASKTYLGSIDRTAYAAVDENCTRQALYCPFDRHVYVLGGNFNQTGTVNRLHRYNPANPLGTMYQASYTIGNSANAPQYSENQMCMNGYEQFEFEDLVL